MKHVFVVETADSVSLPEGSIEFISNAVEALIESHVPGHNAVCYTACNMNSAMRAVYKLFSADTAKSPDELGAAK